MQLKPIGHLCPVCKTDVVGYRNTRRYCSDTCKAKHHITAKKQLLQSLKENENKEALNPLIIRDLYLCEGIIGPDFQKATVNLQSLKSFKFQFGEALQISRSFDKEIYEIGNYRYSQEGENLVIERVGDTPTFSIGYYERWLLEYPEKDHYINLQDKNQMHQKNRILEMNGVWRE